MTAIDSQIPLVDRIRELGELKDHLHNAMQGQGNLLFIAGEAGVGKTRLVEELKTYAQSQGVQILQGGSLYESLTPYMPFIEALRSANLDHLFAREDPPKVECVYLITDTGLLIKDVAREESKLDSTIFAGMLTAVGDFVKDSLSMLSGEERKEMLDTLGYEKYRILIERGANTNLAIILTGRENEFLVNDMKEVLANIDQDYGNVLKVWDGDDNSVKGIENELKPLITSGKYDGIDYAKDNPQIKRNLLFENILLGIERHAKTNPSILCIEDMQWADPSSLALMHYIARNTRKCNLLILGTYRPEDVSITREEKVHHLVEAMQLMSREDLYSKIELERLEEVYIDEMLSSLLTKTDFTDEFMKQMYKDTEGNPFFIVELIRMLVEEGTIEKKGDIWILTKDLKDVHIPSKVNVAVNRRLNRVKEEGREILDIAAVIGEEFTSAILAKAANLEKVHLLKQLRILEQNHKLIRSVDTKYKFDHAKIKEVTYSKIPLELKMEYHALIANAIEILNEDDLDNVIGDLAFHYYHCKNREKALLYLIKAAERAKKDYSNEEAILFYTQAQELEENAQKRMEIFERLGEVYNLIGDYDKSLESFNSALELTKGNKNKIAEIKANIGRIYRKKGEYNESIRKLTEALDLVKNEGGKEEALVLEKIGMTYLRRGDYKRAFEYLEKSLEIGEIIGDQKDIATCLKNIGCMYWSRGEHEKALKNFEKSLKIHDKIGDQPGIHACLNNIGEVHRIKGEYERALEWLEKSLRIGEKIGNQIGIGFNLINIGNAYTQIGEYDKALKHLEKGLKIGKKIGAQTVIADGYWVTAETYLKKSDMKGALDFCDRVFDLSKKTGSKEHIAHSRRIFGGIYCEQKKWEESIENFQESLKIFNEIGMKNELGNAYYEFGLMWKEKGNTEKAKEHLNSALDIFEKLNLEKQAEKVRKEL
ncbi:MAG: tetratricopeptide repeat protein [Thermoplasmata archaeon]|nr:MAG: tetratricopeptide repeat protein [Thermoplasmata archaeon]